MKQVHKEYSHAFLVEPTKLTRLVDVIHSRVGDNAKPEVRDHFDVFMKDNRHDETDAIEGVLTLENSSKHKIERLLITISALAEGAAQPVREVQVDFGLNKKPGKSGEPRVIVVNVKSDDAAWNTATLSEVEEQVERTQLRFMPSMTALLLLFVFMIVVLLTQFVRFNDRDYSRSAWLDNQALDRIEKAVNENRSMTEQEVREVMTMQYRNILLFYRPPEPPKSALTRRAILLGIPIVVVLICSIILLATCYPRAVFLWGDEIDRYANILQRRKTIWGIIFGVMIIGLLGKFFSEGVLSWMPTD